MRNLFTFIFVLLAAATHAQNPGDYHIDNNYKIGSKGTIRLTSSDAKVSIVGSDRNDVNVKIDRTVETKGVGTRHEEFTVDIDERDGNLTIRERSSSSFSGIVGYYNKTYTIKIQAPKGSSLIIKGDDGDYVIEHIDGAIDADLDDADVELVGCNGNEFRFRLDDGEVKMDTGKGSLEVDGDDADVNIRNASFTHVSADIDDGDFIVETSLADNGDYFVNTQDGRVMFTVISGGGRFDIRHDDANVRTDASFAVVEESDDRSRYTLANGTAKVDIRADDANVRLAKR